MNKTWVVIVIAIVVVLALVGGSVFLYLQYGAVDAENGQDLSQKPRRFDVFDGFSLCEQAIRRSLQGHVVSLDSDDRAAKYDPRSNMNQLFFAAAYRPKSGLFGSASQQEKQIYVRCDVSAENNEVEAVRIRPAEEEDFTEVHRLP